MNSSLEFQLLPLTSRLAAEHTRKVDRIASALRQRSSSRPLSLRKKAVSHQVPKARDRRRFDERLDISDLDAILEIDPLRRLCVAEPGVTFVQLVEETLRYGLVPIIVPELKTITVGGAVAGCSVESKSFLQGGFHDTCLEYEVITAKGEVLTCRPDNENALVFQMMHGTFGTLGIISKLVFRLIPARRFVHVLYERHPDVRSYLGAIRQHCEARDVEFMDGIIHSPSEYVLSVGRFTDQAPFCNRYDWLKVYYRSTATRSEDYLRTADYFFRYDNGVTNARPRSFVGRLLFGRFLHSTQVLRLAEKLGWLLLPVNRPTVTVDTFLPITRAEAFLDWWQREMGHYPLWCVPYRRVRHYEWINRDFWSGDEDVELFLDLAIYGMKQRQGVNVYRALEEKLLELRGLKTLISYNYYSEDEFWSIFDRQNYDAVKALTDPNNVFRGFYEKTCRAAMGRD